jgi:hypothetical protein
MDLLTDPSLERSNSAKASADDRALLDCRPTYQRFVVRDKVFTQQFSHIYTKRLETMKPIVR